jgi:hypothetical protein
MHQKNARRLLDRLTGRDKALVEDMRWGEVPRFWRSEKGTRRLGYTRDGRPLVELPEAAAPVPGAEPVTSATAPTPTPPVESANGVAPESAAALTKTGFRAIAVMFSDPG